LFESKHYPDNAIPQNLTQTILSRTKNNIYYAKESIDEAYQKRFGQAVED